MAKAATYQLTSDAGRGIAVAARIGYASRGIVYTVLGTLALMFVLGEGGRLTDNKGALERIGSLPFGDGLLWIGAAGLACYALWCAVCAIYDPWRKDAAKKRVWKRLGYAFGFLWNSSLAIYAGQLAYGASKSSGSTKTYVAELMSVPFGEVLVAILGVITVIVGVHQIYRGIKNKVGEEIETASMSPRKHLIVCRIARLGRSARGFVFCIIGASLLVAAVRNRPGEAHGVGDALRDLAQKPFGEFLIGVVAVGLFAFGIYQLCISRYARVPEIR